MKWKSRFFLMVVCPPHPHPNKIGYKNSANVIRYKTNYTLEENEEN